MPLSFGSSDSAGNVGAQTAMNPIYGILGAGAGLASQFANGNLAPGATSTQLQPWMQNQWMNTFAAQNAAANRTPGQAIAGFTPAQLAAMQNITGSAGLGVGDLQTAQNNASALEQGVGNPQIQNFMNPFTQSAINGTLSTMEQQRAQQDAAINSQGNAAGAWGGDRSAVANNLNDQSWNLAEGNVIGNLNNQGYQSAVNSALQNQTNQLSGNAQLQNAILNRINANNFGNQNALAVGNQQQSLNQAQANWPIQAAQIMGQNLSAQGGVRQGALQNPITGAIAGLQGGLQFGNQLNNLMNQGTSAYNYLANGGLDASQMDTLNSLTSADLGIPSGAGGQAAASAADAAAAPGAGGGSLGAAGYGTDMTTGEFGIPLGTGADAAGAGFAGAGGDALGTTAAESAGASFGGGSGAATGGLSAGLGATAAVAAPLALMAFAASTQPYTLGSAYWNRFQSGLTQGTSGNAIYDQFDSPAQQEYQSRQQLYQMLQAGPTHNDYGQAGAGIPANIMALARSYGMLNSNGSVNQNWSAGPMPSVPLRFGGGRSGAAPV